MSENVSWMNIICHSLLNDVATQAPPPNTVFTERQPPLRSAADREAARLGWPPVGMLPGGATSAASGDGQAGPGMPPASSGSGWRQDAATRMSVQFGDPPSTNQPS